MKTSTFLLAFSLSTLCWPDTHAQEPAQASPAPAPAPLRQPERKLTPAQLQEMEAKERLLLRQKLGGYEEQKRPEWSRTPAPRFNEDARTIESDRQRIAQIEAGKKNGEAAPANSISPEAMEQMVALLNQKMAELDAEEQAAKMASRQPKAKSRNAEVVVKAPAKTAKPAKKVALAEPAPAIVEPPKATEANNPPALTPVGRESGDLLKPKQQKLAELLNLYKADKITPREYHERRARILEQP